ncbi:MAG: formate/nitrite transporter family protein [Myxococcales bacterium FL481]|nr:MAG: formate/nitrite transporter family protein [Myxococcales bacterium FL481]
MSSAESTQARPPVDIARSVEQLGVAKATASPITLLTLAVLAGAFISLGALFFTVVVAGSDAGVGPIRLLGGVAFCLGLVLVVVAGAELFTGNNLVAMAWASGLVPTSSLWRHWSIVYLGNVVGCVVTAIFVVVSDVDALGDGRVGATAIAIGHAKAQLGAVEAFTRGVLCNALVCLAVWLAMGGRTVTDKILAVLFPIAGFVTMGFEHCIANWFFLPYALGLDAAISISDVAGNLVWVSLGNLVGGTLLVAGVYWLAYLRPETNRVGATPTSGR